MILYTASYNETKDPFGIFDSVQTVFTPKGLKKDGALILWGGEDIATEIYNQKPNRYCYSHHRSERDKKEITLVNHAVKYGMPIIGICRGAQLLSAMAGGSLAQHIEGHGGSHMVTLHDEGDVMLSCNSSHHQMMIPPASAKVLATSESTTGLDEHNMAIKYDRVNEVVYFPTIHALGIQPHPEWSSCSQDFINYCTRKIKEYLL